MNILLIASGERKRCLMVFTKRYRKKRTLARSITVDACQKICGFSVEQWLSMGWCGGGLPRRRHWQCLEPFLVTAAGVRGAAGI